MVLSRYAHWRHITLVSRAVLGSEAAAPLLIINARQNARKAHAYQMGSSTWKDQLGNWYGMFCTKLNTFEPVMRDIEQFLQSSTKCNQEL